jgi:methionyl-tRNA formyltransferase
MSDDHRLKIGLIVDSEKVSKYVFDLAEWGSRQDTLIVSCIIIQDVARKDRGILTRAFNSFRKHGVIQLIRNLSFSMLMRLEKRLLLNGGNHRDHLMLRNLRETPASRIVVKPIISPSGFVYRYSSEDVEKIRNLHLDVLIRCGSGILRGNILRSARFGIISFHHADNRINRGGPPGFWEVYNREDSTGFIIQQLTEELDGGNVLFRGKVPTKYHWLLNQACLYTRSNHYMKKLLLDIAATESLPPFQDDWPYYNQLFRQPSLRKQFNYAVKTGANIARKFHQRVKGREERWGVAFGKRDWRRIVMWRALRIRRQPYHFLADPFVISENGGNYCFVEDYDFAVRRGCIAVYELRESGAERIGVAIAEPFHMSFPFLFRFDGRLFMCPEIHASREIRIYQCEKFPLEWKLAKTIMKDVSAVDTMIFEHCGRWWMFTNIDPLGAKGDQCAELEIFHSENPLSDRWIPHKKNPIYVDSSRARNAGLLFDGTRIYRVSQRQGFDIYGKGISINRIVILNQEEYKEIDEHSIEANFFPGIQGSHHFHSNGLFTAFDYVEFTNPRRQEPE